MHPDGFAQNVLNRVVRARFRHGSKSPPSLIEPGRAYEYEVELGYAANVFRARHRVRLDLSSSEFPHLARNHNTGGHPATDERFETARQAVQSRRGPAVARGAGGRARAADRVPLTASGNLDSRR